MCYKKYKLIAALFTGLLLLVLIVGCGNNDQSDEIAEYDYAVSGDVSVSTGNTVTFIENGLSDYKIVRSDKYLSDNTVVQASQKLRRAILESSGAELELATDWVKNEDALSAPEYMKEILVGNTNREETQTVIATLRENDYAIDVVNEKLVIVGGCEEKTVEAVDKFIQLYFSAEQPSLVLDVGYRYQNRYAYNITGMKLTGVNITDYKIIYENGYESAANLLALLIKNNTGFVLEVFDETESESEFEILVGKNVRNIQAQFDENDYVILMQNSKMVISGADEGKVAYAVKAFEKEFFKQAITDLDIPDSYTSSGKINVKSTHNIVSLNVYLSGYGENSVPNRYQRLVALVQECSPDILCLQEVSSTTWYDLITNGNQNSKALTEKYTFVGTGRNGEEGSYDVHVEGAYNAILFSTEKYELLESGTFWLSETPEVPSVGWDGRTRAICTWARLTDKETKSEFLVMNSQLDIHGKLTQKNSAQLINSFIKEQNIPVIFCADLGSTSGEDAYKILSARLTDCVRNKELTVNNYGEKVSQKSATDFIFSSSGDTGFSDGMLIKKLIDGKYVSPHWALEATVEIYE